MPVGKKQPLVENGIVVGTGSAKYEMKNPIARYLLSGFDNSILELVSKVSPSTLVEIGCGEGHVTQLLLKATTADITAMDISDRVLDMAKQTVADSARVRFEKRNIYDIDAQAHTAELAVCCEVLEHLDNPRNGLERLASIASPYALISVPREPLFRTMNFARGAYFWEFGNSPGHLQHWSKRAFLRFVSQAFNVVEIRTPVPWTMILGKAKSS